MAKQKTFKVTTPEFRVSYPNIFEPRLNKLSGKMEFNVQALFPKDADMAAMKAAAKQALVAEFGEDTNKWPCPPDKMRLPFKKQEKKKDQEGVYRLPLGQVEGAPLMNFKTGEKFPPTVVGTERDMDNNLVRITEPKELYGGCWARASVVASAYSKGGNHGVGFYLNSIQKLRDDESFGSASRPEDDFAPVEGADGAEEATSADGLFG